MVSRYDLEYKEGLFLDLHLPHGDEFDLFVYFHGGGLVSGQRGGVEVFAKLLAEHNIATATVEYRMYPDAKFPDFIEDGADALRWLRDNISTFGKCRRLFVGGSSAGGYISMMLCFDSRYLEKVGMKPTDIDGYIHDAGQPTAHFNVLRERGIDRRRTIVDESAPLFFIGLEEYYSPMLFIVSDDDMACRYEQTMLMVKTLNHFGHKENVFLKIMHGTHCEYVNKTDDEGKSIFAGEILSFIERVDF